LKSTDQKPITVGSASVVVEGVLSGQNQASWRVC
jgi:hypothetical protein